MNLALIGGEEFSDGFEDVHAELLQFARESRGIGAGQSLRLAFLPTCAAHDGPETVESWCQTAEARLGAFGAQVQALRILDRASAHDPELAASLAEADVVYLGGGYPQIGMGILAGTPAELALAQAARAGALIAGASAGAMILCRRAWVITPELDESVMQIVSGADPESIAPPPVKYVDCLGFLPNHLCWPHLNLFYSQRWLRNGFMPPRTTVLGVDEQTALLLEERQRGRVLGKGRVMVIGPDHQPTAYRAGAALTL